MKNIKTYEGFFDFLKKKEKKAVSFDEVMECLYDLTDESRIKNELNDARFDGIFADEDICTPFTTFKVVVVFLIKKKSLVEYKGEDINELCPTKNKDPVIIAEPV